ncbi:MAG TPA: AmmeMemoRadiSam system protein A [Phycisphaerae bacterium]|nr:AmmeMemoRadiSam system protein A [Phycisphaerae bacterium]
MAGFESWADFAREVITRRLAGRDTHDLPAPAAEARPQRAFGGVFVTLRGHGGLRACMGTLRTDVHLSDAVRQAAINAAELDPRFGPLNPAELSDLEVDVAVLSPLEPLKCIEEIEIGRDGVLVSRGEMCGLFLPQVAVEHGWDRRTLLDRCCSEKAGLPAAAWQDAATDVRRFTVEVHHERRRDGARG